MSQKKTVVLLCAFIFLLVFHSFGTHLRAGEITAERISCSSLTFRITVTVYIDTESGVRFGGLEDWLDYGDSNDPNNPSGIFVPETTTTPRPDLGKNMGMASFTIEHTYAGYGTYTITYSEQFRNANIANIDVSDANNFFLETKIILDPFFSCNQNLPDLLAPPIDQGCTGVAFTHNAGAVDLDGDSLSYQMTTPKRARDQFVWGYKQLNDAEFYANYQTGDEAGKGKPKLSIDPVSGTLTWDAPGHVGEYNVAFLIIEWRKDRTGVWRMMSSIVRDMQIIVEDCDNNRPDLIMPNDTCVVAGSLLKAEIFGIDPEDDMVRIEVFSDIFGIAVSRATYSPRPPSFQPSSPRATLRFEWQTDCEHVKEQYYQVVVKISDKPKQGPSLVTFKTWRIKVVGPSPEWNNVQQNPGARTASLTWDPYKCAKASTMQVWRKIGGSDFMPDNCQTGMPEFLGYELAAEVQLRDQTTNQIVTQFVDTNGGKGLAPGAVYCYRLVALFPQPKGGESYVSMDTCLAPILVDAPLITHVTVERTDPAEGEIRVSWYSPFHLDRTEYPGPYEYAVYRADDFEGDDVVLTTAQRTRDTTFVDSGLNTESKVYNYRIVLFSNTSANPSAWVAIDTSHTASAVRAEASALTDAISLTWSSVVPWSNSFEQYPHHRIYRGTEGDPLEAYLLIDSVRVTENGFSYRDVAQLDNDRTYYYRVLTRGAYGNPDLKEPFENYSQVVRVRPDDDGKPCTPALVLDTPSCEEVFAAAQCNVKEFTNRIGWSTECSDQVERYRVYAAAGPGEDSEFTLIAEVKDLFYLDKNLTSFARCYKIRAVDGQGNESDWSETVCNDNCPWFELPNVFTPNGDDCNEYFSAYGPFNPYVVNAPESCDLGNENYAKCLRFVTGVSFQVFNRWGKQVYNYRSGSGENSVYINWDGKDSEGKWLASGVYYYAVDVSFDVMDPARKNQTFKGWVHLVR